MLFAFDGKLSREDLRLNCELNEADGLVELALREVSLVLVHKLFKERGALRGVQRIGLGCACVEQPICVDAAPHERIFRLRRASLVHYSIDQVVIGCTRLVCHLIEPVIDHAISTLHRPH